MYSKHILLGRLGHDPDLRYTQEGKGVLTLRVATNESFKDSDGNWKEKSTWHRCVFYGAQAERAAKKAQKGALIFIEGTPFDREWIDDKSNQKRSVRELKVIKYRYPANSNETMANQPIDDGLDGYGILD